MSYESQRKHQIESEIEWLKNKIKSTVKGKHIKDLERQIKEREYNLHLGIYKHV